MKSGVHMSSPLIVAMLRTYAAKNVKRIQRQPAGRRSSSRGASGPEKSYALDGDVAREDLVEARGHQTIAGAQVVVLAHEEEVEFGLARAGRDVVHARAFVDDGNLLVLLGQKPHFGLVEHRAVDLP